MLFISNMKGEVPWGRGNIITSMVLHKGIFKTIQYSDLKPSD